MLFRRSTCRGRSWRSSEPAVCASGVLDVGHHAATAPSPPPRAGAQARRVVILAVVDRRLDNTRIGPASKNGEAMVSRRPVVDIVRDALAVELTRAGHSMVAEGGDVVLAPEVEEFWIDVVSGYKTTLYVARVVIALAVVDGASGERVLARRYVAISGKRETRTPSVWRETRWRSRWRARSTTSPRIRRSPQRLGLDRIRRPAPSTTPSGSIPRPRGRPSSDSRNPCRHRAWCRRLPPPGFAAAAKALQELRERSGCRTLARDRVHARS